MSRHTEEVNSLIGSGYSRNDATEMADTRTLNKIIRDEDEEYLANEEAIDEDEEIDELNDEPTDYEYDEDEEDELSFEDGFQFLDSEGEEEY